MKSKATLLILTTFIIMITSVIFTSAFAEPAAAPPCLTTDLCFEDAIKATNFNGASSLAVDYLNNGNNLDFVTTGWARDRIRIKTGNGNGGFWGTWTWNMGDGTYEVDTADFNGDGHTDIIATNSEQDRVFIRWGHTGWTNASVWNTGNHPHYIATGDLNNDGLDDFATGNTTGNESITVRLRQAGGGFALGTQYSVGDFLGDVAFNDCDNDGDLDMFYSAVFTDPYDQEAFVYLRLNDGNGGFSAAWGIDVDSEGYGINIGSIAFGDLNGDGWDDMIVTRNDHKLIRVMGGINCSFHDPVVSDVQSNPYSLEIADMNEDGDLDLVVSHSLNQLITIYLGHGNGNMTGPYEPELTLDWHVRDIGLGDFNDDGLMDIVYAEESGVWLLLAREQAAPPWVSPWVTVNDIAFAPTGASHLDLLDNKIILSNIGATGDDGASVLLESAKLWSSEIELEGHVGAQLQLEAFANESTTSSLQIVSTTPGMEIRPKFNTTHYMIEYLLKDEPQLLLEWQSDSQTPAASVNWDEIWCVMDLPQGVPSEICRLAFEYGIDPEDLYQVQIDFPVPLIMMAANGNRVEADRIRLVEIPESQLRAQDEGVENDISRIEIRGTAVESLILSDVMMESADPPANLPFPNVLHLPMIVR